MISAEQNELMTRIGAGTPCGKLLRRYWQPVALVDEMQGPRPVKAVRILGEDLVLFKYQNQYGLIERLLRVIGGPGDPGTRIENRIGEPAANPYLYFASQIYSGLDGMARKLSLPPSADTPYEAKAEFLPRTLAAALDFLKSDGILCAGLGQTFVDYYCRIKEAELARFNLEVSEWEHREYFDLF